MEGLCHFCLEPKTLPPPSESKRWIFCLICGHELLEKFFDVPCHLLNLEQTKELLVAEATFILGWNLALFRSYKRFGFSYSDPEINEEDTKLGLLEYARDTLRESFKKVVGPNLEIEAVAVRLLAHLPHGDGGMAVYLEAGREWRKKARELSAKGADLSEITKFQIDLVHWTSWGAYGSMGGDKKKAEMIKLLEERLK